MRERQRRKFRSSSWLRQYRLADRTLYEAEHHSTSAFDAAVILFEAVVQVAAGPMPHAAAELRSDRPWIGIVAVRRDPVRNHTNRLRRSKEALGCGEVAVLEQHDVDQGAIAIDRTIEISPIAVHPNIRFVDIPATADFALSASPEFLRQSGRELCLPVTDRLIAEHDAAYQEHFGQIMSL